MRCIRCVKVVTNMMMKGERVVGWSEPESVLSFDLVDGDV